MVLFIATNYSYVTYILTKQQEVIDKKEKIRYGSKETISIFKER